MISYTCFHSEQEISDHQDKNTIDRYVAIGEHVYVTHLCSSNTVANKEDEFPFFQPHHEAAASYIRIRIAQFSIFF